MKGGEEMKVIMVELDALLSGVWLVAMIDYR